MIQKSNKKRIHSLEVEKEEIETQIGKLIHDLYPTTYENSPVIDWSLGVRFLNHRTEFYELNERFERIKGLIEEIKNENN